MIKGLEKFLEKPLKFDDTNVENFTKQLTDIILKLQSEKELGRKGKMLNRLSYYIDELRSDDKIDYDVYLNLREMSDQLGDENAALRERLSLSLELPYMEQTVSRNGTEDTILYYLENGKLQQECFNNKFPEQLQTRLAELKGEKK